jgi:sulfite exporter TauE/SafE/copper chaperone CopZ
MASMTKDVRIEGMHCARCEKRVSDIVSKIEGVDAVSVGWKTGRGTLTFDDRAVDRTSIAERLGQAGYRLTFSDDAEPGRQAPGRKYRTAVGTAFAVLGFGIIVYLVLRLSSVVSVPDITPTMGLGLLFVVGLLTGFHCVGMCGGFVVGYTTKSAAAGTRPAVSHLSYGGGKLLSYTVIGAGFGLLGSFITFTPLLRGVAGVLAGAFLLVYGLSMVGAFSWAKRIRIGAPAFLDRFIDRRSAHSRSPVVVGLLSGLMIACGPLQAVYIMAAATGSAVEGAKMLFVFGAGTLPVMLGFGYTTSLISSRFTSRILRVSGAVVMVLGVVMINRGLALSGTGLDASSLVVSGIASEDETGPTGLAAGVEMADGYQVIRMKVTRYGWEPDRFVLVKGVPVRWVITGVEINSCNNAIVVPEYGLNFRIKEGEQVIEFTPNKDGVVSWSCWMGMIPGSFVVKDGKEVTEGGAVDPAPGDGALPRRGTCRLGASGGGCCGGSIQ